MTEGQRPIDVSGWKIKGSGRDLYTVAEKGQDGKDLYMVRVQSSATRRRSDIVAGHRSFESCLHDHEACCSSLHVPLRSESLLTLHGSEGVLLAVDLASNLEVIIAERFLAVNAGETARMELLALLGFEVRSFDTTVAVGTQRVVELVIMVFTVWVVVNDIEVGGRKG
jgi:hypothetical protein